MKISYRCLGKKLCKIREFLSTENGKKEIFKGVKTKFL